MRPPVSPRRHLRIAVVSTGSPELENLAAHLSRQDLLSEYVHPFIISHARRQSKTGQLASRIPRFGTLLDRRIGPADLPDERVRSAAIVSELLRAIIGTRLPSARRHLIAYRNRRLGVLASKLTTSNDIIVASFGVARYIAGSADCSVVLNMPTCHPSFQNAQFDRIEKQHPLTEAINMRNSEKAVHATKLDLDRAQAILCGSRFAASTLAPHCPQDTRLMVAPYGVDATHFQPSPRPHAGAPPLDVVSVATLTPAKGVLDVISAFEGISPEHAKLTIFGSAPHGVSWLKRGSQHHAGRLDRRGLAERLGRADIMVLGSWFEGLPLSVLEALAGGLACIVTDRGGNEAVRDGIEGFVVQPGDPDAIRDAIMNLSEQPELLKSMKLAARRRAEEMSWDRYAEIATGHLLALRPRSISNGRREES